MTTFDEEWAQLQAEAREETIRTRLNSGEGGGGTGSGGTLEVTDAHLSDIESSAESLANALDQSGHVAENSTHVAGILLRTPGFETGPALIDVSTRWQSQADALRDSCLHIAAHLQDSAQSVAEVEAETEASLPRAQGISDNPRVTPL